MPTIKSVIAGLLLCLAAVAPGRAQLTIDAKISYWLSGYYNGKRRNTNLNAAALRDFIEKLRDYCVHNQDAAVMKAAETLLGDK